MKNLFVLVFLTVVLAVAVPETFAAGQVLFADDFSTNPNTSSKWTISKDNPDPNTGIWDSTLQAFYLTTVNAGCTGIDMLANVDLTARKWEASFKYRIGGNSYLGADGMVFMFYKKKDYIPGMGGLLGFTDSNWNPVPGLGIEFDGWYNWEFPDVSDNHIALIENSVGNHLVAVNDARTEDNLWHAVLVKFNEGQVSVSVDGGEIINYILPAPDYTNTGVGFSGGVCGGKNDQILKDFVLTVSAVPVAIDIKPGSYPNSINLGSAGTTPVAILSSPSFDATKVDPLSVTLSGATVGLKGKGTPMVSFEDVNGDGIIDMVVHVNTNALQLFAGDVTATLEGKTFDGTLIQGMDSVRIVPVQ
jgi:lectin family protein